MTEEAVERQNTKLAEFLRARGYTVAGVCRLIDEKPTRVSNYGRRMPDDLVNKIAAAIGCRPDEVPN